jgi:hypothetical protein
MKGILHPVKGYATFCSEAHNMLYGKAHWLPIPLGNGIFD